MKAIYTEEQKGIQLDILSDVISFCEEQKLNYFLAYGTLIGAVRHHGYIPWDDDMDIGIPREDYDRFLKLCDEGKAPFEMHSFFNDPDHFRYFAHIEDPSVKVRRQDRNIEEISSA